MYLLCVILSFMYFTYLLNNYIYTFLYNHDLYQSMQILFIIGFFILTCYSLFRYLKEK